MSAPESGKDFDDLSDDEVRELENRDWSVGEIMRAINLALEARDMPAVAALMMRLAVKDPAAAQAILTVIEAR